MSFGPVSSLSASGQAVFDALRDDIVFGRRHPRERLVESELIARLGQHRAAVREALSALEQAGLVERPRNKGASVKDLGPEQVEQLYAVRALLETAAVAAMPMPPAPEALEALVEVQRQHQAAVEAGDLRRIFDLNNRFHQALYAQSGNPVLVELIQQCAVRALTVRFHPYMDRSFLERVCAEHWAMVEACRAGDREALLALVRAHLPLAKDRYLQTYDEVLASDAAPQPLAQRA